jgi:hypothetical protein
MAACAYGAAGSRDHRHETPGASAAPAMLRRVRAPRVVPMHRLLIDRVPRRGRQRDAGPHPRASGLLDAPRSLLRSSTASSPARDHPRQPAAATSPGASSPQRRCGASGAQRVSLLAQREHDPGEQRQQGVRLSRPRPRAVRPPGGVRMAAAGLDRGCAGRRAYAARQSTRTLARRSDTHSPRSRRMPCRAPSSREVCQPARHADSGRDRRVRPADWSAGWPWAAPSPSTYDSGS